MFDLITRTRNPWSIFDELESLQADMNRLVSGRGGRRGRSWGSHATYPPMNVWSSAEGVVIDAEIPGVEPANVDISVKDDRLTLRGKVNVMETPGTDHYRRRERPTGEFVRTLQLPFRADTNAVTANCHNGVLRLTVPRSEADRPKRIAIEAS